MQHNICFVIERKRDAIGLSVVTIGRLMHDGDMYSKREIFSVFFRCLLNCCKNQEFFISSTVHKTSEQGTPRKFRTS